MEYVPYRITAGSHKIKIYQNESHGLKTFTSLEDGKEFLKSEAIEVVKYEESGKNAENCVYNTETVTQEIHSVKVGLFVQELEDGFVLKEKRYDGYISWVPTITEKEFYMLAPLVRRVSAPPRRVEFQSTNESSSSVNTGNLIAELNAELKATLENGVQLRPTGLLDELLHKPEEEEQEEVIIESYEDTEYSSEYCLLDIPALPELPPLPKMVIPLDVQSFEPILAKASIDNEIEQAILELDEDINDIEEQQDFIDRALEEISMLKADAQIPPLYERPSSEYSDSDSEESTEESESESDFWFESSENSYGESGGYSYSV